MKVNSNLFLVPPPDTDAFGAAEILARARQARLPLATFPGLLPNTRAEAYAIQDWQILLRQSGVIGWKVALTNPLFLDAFGAPRLVGPAFADRLIDASDPAAGEISVSAIPNGFCAVEAEFIAVIDRDLDGSAGEMTAERATGFVRSLHVGVEVAGSPLPMINDLGSFAVAADCGNNDGLILGPEIKNWQDVAPEALGAVTSVDGAVVGTGHAGKVPGGPIAALAFLITCLAERGIRLRAGDLVSTGATTGIHEIKAGQSAELDFGQYGILRLKIGAGR